MNKHTDTRLTDFALDELSDAERREVEALLKADGATLAEVEELRRLARLVRDASLVATEAAAEAGGVETRSATLRSELESRLAAEQTPAELMPVHSRSWLRSHWKAATVGFGGVLAASAALFFLALQSSDKSGGLAAPQRAELASAAPATGGVDLIPLEGVTPRYKGYAQTAQSSPPVETRLARVKLGDLSGPSPSSPHIGGIHDSMGGAVPAGGAPSQPPNPAINTYSGMITIGATIQNALPGNRGAALNTAGVTKQGAGTLTISNQTAATAAPSEGRFMLGVGVNSNSGMLGRAVIDEPTEVAGVQSSAGPPAIRGAATLGALQLSGAHSYRGYYDITPVPTPGAAQLEKLSQNPPGDLRDLQTEAYDAVVENPFVRTTDAPLSTFSIDVDTASYSNVRRMLTAGALPPPGAVRIEEFLNYFTYDYPQPKEGEPFSVTTEAARCPWNGEHVLVRVGLKGREIHRKERPATNLVFLVDVSGSMQNQNKLPLVRESLKMMVRELGDSDHVSIVVYAGSSGLALPPTGGNRKQTILEAIESLESGGSTNGAAGVQLAYQLAVKHFIKGGVNRVVLATDGDFNVGVTSQDELVRLIETSAKSGVFFSALGYGMGNLKDSTLEKLADKGNGNYAYIDSLAEARKVLVEQMSGTLVTIAKDVKIQIEFNPARVAAYRLVGYENRLLAAQDFNDDKKDAGEIGAGHTVTALYELIPAGKKAANEAAQLPAVDPLKYQQPPQQPAPTDAAAAKELLTLKLRYKQPDGDKSKLLEQPLADDVPAYAKASGDFKFASAVAGFGMLLRHSQHSGTAGFDAVLELAQEGISSDAGGYRKEFLELVRKAKNLTTKP